MQYILTQEEMNLRQELLDELREANTAKLQKLCTLVCNHMPVEWCSKTVTWGCILSDTSHGYCDACPVSDDCPHPYKEWSN